MSAPTPQAVLANGIKAVYIALGNFIVAQLGLSTNPPQVIQGYPNRTSMPDTLPLVGEGYPQGFVVMTAMTKKRLRTNVDVTPDVDDPSSQTEEMGQKLDMQLDVYGPNASDWADILVTLLRDNVSYLALVPACAPLYADDPIRAPLTNAEQQYEDRWIITARLQYNPVVTTPQQYADALGPVNTYDAAPASPGEDGFAPPLP